MSVDAEKYKVRVGDGDGAVEVELGVSSITVPAVTLKPGPVPEVLIGHSKGLKQILLERGLITVGEKTKGACDTNDKKKRIAAQGQSGIGQTESADVPKHAGMAGGTACCLEYLLSEQPDFKRQQNAIQELVISRGHHCIFLPKFHPELNFIERYWSRVKWHARQHSTGTVQGLKAAIDEAMRDGACDLALIRRYARTAWRWVDAYNKGLDGVLAAWAVRKSKCHRFVTGEVDRLVNEMKVEQDRAMQAREEAKQARAEDPPVVLGVLADLVAAGALGDGDDE